MANVSTEIVDSAGNAVGGAIYNLVQSCIKSKDSNFCYDRWEKEDSNYYAWKNLGPRVVAACKSRAAERRTACIRNGGKPSPLEPPNIVRSATTPEIEIITVTKDCPDETKRVFDDDENLIEEACYSNGVLHGKRTLWSSKGVKIGVADYRNGKLHGPSALWNEDGKLASEASYENDELNGPYRSFWDNGAIKETGEFKRGQRIGIYQWYSEDGKLVSEHHYSDS